MQYRTMESTGDRLSALGFGCMRLPQSRGRVDEERAEAQIVRAIEAGVNYLDTAVPYHMGASEMLLGKLMAKGRLEGVRVATKLFHWSVRSRVDMDQMLEGQLKRLQTDCIGYYLVHNIGGHDWKRLQALGIEGFLQQAQASGRVRHLGFSSHDSTEGFKAVVDGFDWAFCQVQYNYLDEENQAGSEGLQYAADKGLGIVVMEPLRGGNLTKAVPPAVQAIWDEAEVTRSPAEWALRWVWNNPAVTVVLSGMNEEAHVEENLRIADEALPNSLTEHELALIRRAADTYRKLMPIGCTGCGYCLPCPAGVNIPACFEIYNNRHMFKSGFHEQFRYLTLRGEGGKPAYASLCRDCGKCAKACPQHLAAPELLKDVRREFESPRTLWMKWALRPAMALLRRSALKDGRKGKGR